MPAKKLNKNLLQFTIYALTVLLLILTSVNLNNYLSSKKVLGAETKSDRGEKEFWNEFLSKNPDYIPGWIELGDHQKIKAIDPNYFREP